MRQTEYKKMEMVEKNHFWFLAKRKFLGMVLKRYATTKKLCILDVGCGTGGIMEFLKKNGFKVFGIDVNDEAVKYCRQKDLEVTSGLATKMDFLDNIFDIVLALDVLEHVENDSSAVKEIYRVLKKGGILIATVPAHKFLWSYHDKALHHWRRYNKKEIGILISEKLNIKLITWIHAYIFLPILIMRWIKNVYKGGNSESDVKEISRVNNMLGKICYIPELIVFKIFGRLPMGASLLVVAEKQ